MEEKVKDMHSKNEALKSQLEQEQYKRLKDNEGLSKYISLLCQVGVVGIVFTCIMLITLIFIPNLVDVQHKEFIVGILIITLGAILTMLVLARKNVFVLLTMMLMGMSVFSFGLGWVVCSFKIIKG